MMQHGSELQRALDLVACHRWKAARTLLQACVDDDPTDFDALLGLARTLKALRQYGGARTMYRRALQIRDQEAEIWAELLEIDSNFKERLKDAVAATERFPANLAFAGVKLGCLQVLGRTAALEDALNRLVDNPQDAEEAWLLRASVRSNQALRPVSDGEPFVLGDFGLWQARSLMEEVLRCYREAYASNSGSLRATLGIARQLRLLGRFDEVLNFVASALPRLNHLRGRRLLLAERDLSLAGEQGRRERLAGVLEEQAQLLLAEPGLQADATAYLSAAEAIRLGWGLDEFMFEKGPDCEASGSDPD